ncbi:hypothetical protein BRD00_02770 [Halobacteriales archaeon QS_8_69_26]|nr:MAG: hypothetical protein BRD00_02770 [Halobacteriales archaeon QS_8_69_26]
MKILKNIQKIGISIAAGGVVSGIFVALMVVAGATSMIGQQTVQETNTTLEGWMALLLVTMPLAIGAIGGYMMMRKQISKSFGRTVEMFGELPDIGKAFVTAIPLTLLAGLAVVVTDIHAFSLAVVPMLGIAGVSWLVQALFVFQHIRGDREDRTLGGGAKMLLQGWAVASVPAIMIAGLNFYLLGGYLPGYLPLVVLLTLTGISAGVIAKEVYARERWSPDSHRKKGWILTRISQKTGFAQQHQIQSVTTSLAIGFVAALMLATMVNLIVSGLLIPVISFFVFLGVSTAGAYRWFNRARASLDLVIVDVRNRSSGDRRRELVVQNEGNTSIDLRKAKIRDTEGDLFRTSLKIVLQPGQTTTFEIPPQFLLAPTDEDMRVGGWSIQRDARVPILVTRDGKKYELWEQEEKHRRVRKQKLREEQDVDDRFEEVTGVDADEERTGYDIDLSDNNANRRKNKRSKRRRRGHRRSDRRRKHRDGRGGGSGSDKDQ